MTAHLAAIYRYPVKGLSPDALDQTRLAPGSTLPADRLYAIENGPTGFDPAAPTYFPKSRFLMLMKNERLAALATRYDHATHRLTIAQAGNPVVDADLSTAEGCRAVEGFFTRFMTDELRGPPKVLYGGNHSFSDVARKVVSIINLASVARIEAEVGAPVDPLRFRANLYVAGWPAWHEFDLMGREIAVGSQTRLKVFKRIVRCAATQVDPSTGVRDIDVPGVLRRIVGHIDCGVYAEVVTGGDIAIGDPVGTVSSDAQ
jgi:uncharacterized protein YcbX